MAQPDQPFRLIRSQRGAEKLTEGGFSYGKQRRVGGVTHLLCERRGFCKALNNLVKDVNETRRRDQVREFKKIKISQNKE